MAKLAEVNKEAPKRRILVAFGSTASRVRKHEKISQILKKCIKIELYTVEKYRLLASQTINPYAKVLFERLSSEGKNHAKILGIIKETLTETGKIDKSVVISSLVVVPKDTKLSRYGTDVEGAYHAMKSHLDLSVELKKPMQSWLRDLKIPQPHLCFADQLKMKRLIMKSCY
ncbi:MAG: hypothetical protein ACE5KD_01960 [Candidatus Bathyarchaeia archaeon]